VPDRLSEAAKQRVVALARRGGLLPAFEWAAFAVASARAAPANLRCVDAAPEFASLPMRSLYDMYGHASISRYAEDGRGMALALANAVSRHSKIVAPRIADWGCGLGRVLRHLPKEWRLHGFDVNARAVAWCAENIPFAEFRRSSFLPPLASRDAAFDAVISVSVFTHLDDDAARAWAAELKRVLTPQGLLLATFHASPPDILLPDERRVFEQGEPVRRGRTKEGSRLFASYAPEPYLRRLFSGFDWLEGPSPFFGQSLVVLRNR
jgi:SAM-dependent methyltransferase